MNAKQLIEARKKLGLTQRDLAEKLKVTPHTVANWERRRRAIRPSMAKMIGIIIATAVDNAP